ncbi:hypothetical protein Daus18300_013132 [Diaporthe australafricana]|uniref:Phosphatidylethanolamine-binding protein n=1 Tax=Diaporthe australafricana TaxID=127596 RepID=A0ABR3W088_9PEZI
MISKYLIALWAGATLVVGKTPSGFTPNSDTDLILLYGQMPAMNGVVVDKAATASAPTIATKSRLDGTSYAVIMMDLDIPSDQNPHTFLHWMQTDLTPATKASTITGSNGSTQAFTLSNAKNTSAIVAYTQPAPPAQNPLSHRYTEILIDTSSMSAEGLSALQSAAETRVGFDTNSVLEAAGLSNNVVAGNSFNVTNAGPATSSTSTVGSNSTSSGTGNDQKSGQDTKSSNGTASVNQAGTLTSTISSAPGGATAGSWATVTAADKDGSGASAASRALGGDFMLTVSLITGVGFTTAFVLSL